MAESEPLYKKDSTDVGGSEPIYYDKASHPILVSVQFAERHEQPKVAYCSITYYEYIKVIIKPQVDSRISYYGLAT